jgi:hypothetical protein
VHLVVRAKNCKHAGHNAHECPKKGNNRVNGKANQRGRQGKFQGKCDNCGRQGHKVDACWEKAENKDKRPKWFQGKDNGEVGATASDVGSKKIEFLLCSHYVRISDTGATVHTMAYKHAFHELTEVSDSDLITMGNGLKEMASKIES